ncbi:MAG TPA: murein biosynthesis integral membrane protein MurJ [Ilumatobacter sp.]|nr:murein biosynthesis integral membrane protein MurJ [Ilumatobacter sp.]
MTSLLRSNMVVAAGTALSRVSGLLRTFVFGYVLGQTALTDAYLLANETPNIVYDLLLGGVLSATLVPLFTQLMHDDADGDSQRDTNVVITVAVTLMAALTVVAMLAAPLIFRLYTLSPAEGLDVELFRRVGTTLTRVFLLQILFYGLTGIANAYLNSRRRFFAAAWSPILPNLIIVATLLSLPGAGSRDYRLADIVSDSRVRLTLGLGATLGIAAMAAVVVPAMFAAGLRFRPQFQFRHPAVRKLLVLSGWTVGFVGANQVALLVVRNLAQSRGEGLASSYFAAFTWFVLPHGLLAVSIATTFQPELARSVKARNKAAFVRQSSLGVRMIALLTFPAAAALVVLAEPVIGLMQWGRFDPVATHNTARALAGLAVGLVGFSVYLFTLRGFYAHQDTRTPFVLNVFENLLNIVLAFVFVRWWGVLGLGLAYGLAYLVAAAWALRVLSYKVPGFPLRDLLASGWRMVLAAVLMAEAMWLVTHRVAGNAGAEGLAQLLVGGIVGLVVYAAVLFVLQSPELGAIRQLLNRRS